MASIRQINTSFATGRGNAPPGFSVSFRPASADGSGVGIGGDIGDCGGAAMLIDNDSELVTVALLGKPVRVQGTSSGACPPPPN